MMQRRRALLIVAEQQRARRVRRLDVAVLPRPGLERLCRPGVAFADRVAIATPCAPARCLTLQMNPRVLQKDVPRRACPVIPGKALRCIGSAPTQIGYSRTGYAPHRSSRMGCS
jgi:hypothetical protein